MAKGQVALPRGSLVRTKAVLVISSGGDMLASLRLLLRSRFRKIRATSGPGDVLSILSDQPISLILLSVGFSTKIGANGRKLF